MKTLKLVSNYLIIVVLVFIVLIIVLTLSSKIKFLSVLSGSMRPEIEQGDMIITIPVKTAKIKQGDIITFKRKENILVTHRVKEVYNDYGKTFFITKGDANSTQDKNPVNKEQVVGLYLMKLPKSLYFITSTPWSILFFIIPLFIIKAALS